MNLVNSRCFLVLFVYFSSAVLVIVDGQSTTDDDDTDKYDIIKFIDRIAKLEHNLAAAVHTVAELKGQLAATTTKPAGVQVSFAFS